MDPVPEAPAPRDATRRLLPAALGACLAAKVWLTWGRYLSQDEFESMHQGWLLYAGGRQFLDFNSNHPPLMFELCGLLNHLTSDLPTLLHLGRALTLLSAGATLFLVHRIARAAFGGRAARWAAILYAVNSTFWEWSTEIRTDSLMVPLWLAAVLALVGAPEWTPRRRWFVVGLLLGTAFWANQKVVFHCVPIGLFLCLGARTGRGWTAREAVPALAGALLPAALLVIRFSVLGSLPAMLEHNFLGAARLTSDDPYAWYRRLTLEQLAERDFGFLAVELYALIWVVRTWRERTWNQRFVAFGAVWMPATLWLTPGPFPYYLLSVLPLGAVMGGGGLDAAPKVPAGPRARAAVALALAGLYASFPLVRMTRFLEPTNRDQLRILRLAQELVPPEGCVFDGAGTVVNRPDAYPFHWVLWAPELEQLRAGRLPPLLPELRAHDCRLLVVTYRLGGLPQADREALVRAFVPLWGPFRVPGFDSGALAVGEAPVEFELWRDGTYDVDPPGAEIDGAPVSGAVRLAGGRHTVRVRGAPARVRVREHPRAPLPPDEPDVRALLGRYGYDY